MAIRLFLALVALVGVMWYLSWYSKADSSDRNRSLITVLLYGMAAALLIMVLTGRIPWLFAMLSAATPWISRAFMIKQMWSRINQATGNQSRSPPPETPSSTMSREEALQILGLEGDVTEQQIKEAHRKLIQRIHPDRGGSGYLASWINQAKDTLLQDPPDNKA